MRLTVHSKVMMRLSVLDQSPVAEGSTGSQALQNTIDLARLTDGLGYHRYWVAEHHGGPSLAGPSPEVLIGPIASATSRMRVGSGGVMLPHYSPLKVAQSFSVLAGLYPGRIDLGIGRAAGTDPMTTLALQRDRRQAAPDDFPSQLAELLAYYDDTFPDGHSLGRYVGTLPGRPEVPVPWLLGSSAQSAIWAGDIGLPYAFADFINNEGVEIAALSRDRRRRVGARGRHRRGGPPPRREPPDALHAAAPGPAHPGPTPGQGGAVPRDPGRDRRPAPPRDRRHAGHRPRGAHRRRRAVRGRGGHRRHDHVRPRGPAALVRADRRRVRARGRRGPGRRGDARLTATHESAGRRDRRAKPRP